MSNRRKFFIALNVIAVCIASLSYALHQQSRLQTAATTFSSEMPLVAIPNLLDTRHSDCKSCVITSRAALGIAD